MSESKWLSAQQHEREYFDSGRNKQWQTPHSAEYWKAFLCITSIDGRGLEVGCGPNGLYKFVECIVGVDSINYRNSNFVNAMAEHLPFKSNSYDFVICCNSLDHCQEPQKAVDEMLRVSNKIIIWTNTFPSCIRWMLSRIDRTHPHHFNVNSLIDLFPDVQCNMAVEKTLFSWHGKHASMLGKLKLLLASILGIKGVCLHLEVC